MGQGVPKDPRGLHEIVVASRDREFLLTGGDGSYALLSLDWKNRRKYHGFFIKSLSPPSHRMLIFSGIKEYVNGEVVRPEIFVYPNKFLTTNPEITREVFIGDGVKINYSGRLEIRPYFNYRHMYDVRGSPGNARFSKTSRGLEVEIDKNKINLKLSGNYRFMPDPIWERFEYDIDKERYEDWQDFNFSPGRIMIDGNLTIEIGMGSKSAQDFLVSSRHGKLVIAGYPWFSFWTRDSLIYTRYLIASRRFDEARQVLTSVYKMRRENILPEFMDDKTGRLVYSGLDGNLLFLSVLEEYINASKNWGILEIVDPESIIMPAIGRLDGNLFLDSKSWMDTINREKPVEIQAFMYNSLLAVSRFLEKEKNERAKRYKDLADELKKNFERRYVKDYIIDSMNDYRFRPNFLFTSYFDHKIVQKQDLKKSIKRALDELVTPLGLRTLSPSEPGYFGVYEKSKPESYHNGTVWPWLIGPLFDASMYAYPQAIDEIGQILENLENHKVMAGVIGQINEIFDGDPPYRPRGCPAQAWSLSEFERVKLLLEEKRKRNP